MEKSLKRFYYRGRLGESFVMLDGTEHHHLSIVKRCKVGEVVMLVCGDEFDYRYEITGINREETRLSFISKSKNTKNPKTELVVFVGLIRLENLSLIVEKLGEIGATRIVPFTCARSNTPASSVNISKLGTVAEQSCKQSGRSIPLKIHPVLKFNEMISSLSQLDEVFYADRGEKKSKISRNETTSNEKRYGLVIGPEGGLTIDENLAITEISTPITLGSRTLRSETAAMVGTALVLAKLGEL